MSLGYLQLAVALWSRSSWEPLSSLVFATKANLWDRLGKGRFWGVISVGDYIAVLASLLQLLGTIGVGVEGSRIWKPDVKSCPGYHTRPMPYGAISHHRIHINTAESLISRRLYIR